MSGPEREMTLNEWIERLPSCHLARKELEALRKERDILNDYLHLYRDGKLDREVLAKERDAWKKLSDAQDVSINSFRSERSQLIQERDELKKDVHQLADLVAEAAQFLMVKQNGDLEPRNIYQEFQDMRKERDELKEQAYIDAERADKAEKERDEYREVLEKNCNTIGQGCDCDMCVVLAKYTNRST